MLLSLLCRNGEQAKLNVSAMSYCHTRLTRDEGWGEATEYSGALTLHKDMGGWSKNPPNAS